MNRKNIAVLGIEEYNELLLENERMRKLIQDTFTITEDWYERPRLSVNAELHRDYLSELLEKFEEDNCNWELAKDLNGWRSDMNVFDRIKDENEDNAEEAI